jgi:hypothetical protein
VMAPCEGPCTQCGDPLESSLGRELRGEIGRIRQEPKSDDALERGGSGRSSSDARGQHNPCRAKDPWEGVALSGRRGLARNVLTRSGLTGTTRACSQQERRHGQTKACAEGRSVSTGTHVFLKPYWGKPAVRNSRGGAGNGVLMHDRACALLDAGEAGPNGLERPGTPCQDRRRLWVAVMLSLGASRPRNPCPRGLPPCAGKAARRV